MALDLPTHIPQLFKHSSIVKMGGGKERIGQDVIIVSLDGCGDFDSIQEAIDSATSDGAIIKIKAGTYTLTGLTLKSNITLQGDGFQTILNISGSANGHIDITSKSNVTIKDMKINLSGTLSNLSRKWHFDITGSINLQIKNVSFTNASTKKAGGDLGFISVTTAGAITFNLIDCIFTNTGAGDATGVLFDIGLDESTITGNVADGITNLIQDTGDGYDITSTKITKNLAGGINILGSAGQNIDKNSFTDNNLTFLFLGDDGTADNNRITGNYFRAGASSKVYLGANSNNNSVTGNVHDAANVDGGAGNVESGDVRY